MDGHEPGWRYLSMQRGDVSESKIKMRGLVRWLVQLARSECLQIRPVESRMLAYNVVTGVRHYYDYDYDYDCDCGYYSHVRLQ